MRRLVVMTMALAAALTLRAERVAAQDEAMGFAQAQVADLEGMKDKFMGLGEAFPEDLMDWSPMEGVRSVKDVLVLAAVECNLFPTMWGFDAPEGVGENFGAENERLGAMTQADLVAAVGVAFDHLIGIVGDLDGEARMATTSFFGRTVDVETAIALAAFDMHEHLGQLIAYARSNEIVPPWSR